ncbi:MAG TPA: VapE domain-containing protein [Gaiellaceae bacterium]|nr:VapE domain-containing protein [Gaiellaceae bacterium]
MIDHVLISALKDKHDSAPRRSKVAWGKFVEAFQRPRKTQCLVANCKHHLCVHKNGRAWSPAVYPPSTPRQKQFVEEISVLVVDLDHLSDEQLAAALVPLVPYQRILHASHSDRPAGSTICTCGSEPGALHGQSCPSRVDRCVRVIVALSRPVLRDEWPRFWPTAMAFLKQPADPSTCDANRLYYLPSRPSDSTNYYFEAHDGGALDVEMILAIAPPETPSLAEHLRVDPAGIVEPGQRHAMLKSMAGAMRFRGSGYDEIEAALLNANKARCNPPKSDAEVRAIARWAAEQPMRAVGPRGGEGEGGGGEGGDSEPDFLRDKNGQIYNNQFNMEVAFRKLRIGLAHDDFSGDDIIQGLPGHGPRLDDQAMIHLRLLVDSTFHFLPGRELFRDVVSNVAWRNRFHPVQDYLKSLAWDQEPRIERWLIDYAGAPDTPYVRAVSRIVLVAACRRIRKPGSKYDEMLILESPQGTDKSSGLRALAVNDDWFTDDLPLGSDTRRFIESTVGKWIVEAGELKGMGRSDINALKACLSRQRDEARMAYGHKNHRVARQFVIVGTTNETDGYLRDATGNRRFWPVRVQRFDLARLRADRDQLWAEAAEAEALGESIRLDPKLYEEAAVEQEARLRDDDPLIDVLYRALGTRTGKLRISDAYLICGIESGRATQDQIDRFGRAIRKLGWERKRRRFDGQLEYAYVKGSEAEREVNLIVEYDQHMRSVRIEVDKGQSATN